MYFSEIPLIGKSVPKSGSVFPFREEQQAQSRPPDGGQEREMGTGNPSRWRLVAASAYGFLGRCSLMAIATIAQNGERYK